MSGRSRREGQDHGTNTVVQKNYGVNELNNFISQVQVEAKISGKTIRKVTGKNQLINTQFEALIQSLEFGMDFLKGMAFDMCLLDLQTIQKGDHQTMAKSITDIFRVKADRGGLYKNHNAWIIDIFCYDELERPTPFALAVILLERIKDHFCSNLDTNEEFLKPFKVAHQPKGNVESGFQQAVEILRPLVERVFERFPEASLNFMISGITTNDPSKGRLATLVLLLGRLMESVRMTKPQSRIKCIFCGNDFMKTEGFTDKRSDETVDINSLLGNFSRMALKQGNSIEGQNQTLTSIMGRMLVLRWSANDLKWERLKLKGEVSSKAIVLVSNALTVC